MKKWEISNEQIVLMGLLLICIGYIMCIWVNYIILHIPFNIEVAMYPTYQVHIS